MRMFWCNPTKLSFRSQGFTLIELLVTTTLSLVLAGGALAAYNNFNSQQGFIQTSKNVIADFERTKARSQAGEKPESCTSLSGHRIRGAINTSRYFMSIRCDGGTELETQQKNLPSGFTFTTSFDILFPPNPGPVSTAAKTINIAKSGNSKVYRFTVLPNGVIQEVGLVAP